MDFRLEMVFFNKKSGRHGVLTFVTGSNRGVEHWLQ
jgi:hypothetical protein